MSPAIMSGVSRLQRLLVLGVAAAILIVGGVVAASSGEVADKKDDSGPVTIEVRGAKPVGGVQPVTVTKGGTIDLTVDSDTADEMHLHGYDKHADVEAGGTARLKVPATIEGRFEVELEGKGKQLAEVTVQP